MRDPKLTTEQKEKLAILEPMLREAASSHDFERAKEVTFRIQNVLRPTGNETRLMESKNRLFEVAMVTGNINTAIKGFMGVRKKVSTQSRLYLEATSLLAICFLRQKNLDKARPLMIEALKCVKNIKSETKRSEYKVSLALRFDEEALLASLALDDSVYLDPGKIQDEAGRLIYEKHEDEILELLGAEVPEGAMDYVKEVHKESQGLLTFEEKKKLPSPESYKKRKELGEGVLSAFKTVIWRSLCDKESEVYRMWFTNGMQAVLDKKYLTIAIVGALNGLSIGGYAIAVYLTALLIKIGIETFCSVYRPSDLMDLR